MNDILARQPALITTDAKEQPVVIPVGELRAIRDGRHDATDEQIQGMARFIVEQVEDGK